MGLLRFFAVEGIKKQSQKNRGWRSGKRSSAKGLGRAENAARIPRVPLWAEAGRAAARGAWKRVVDAAIGAQED